MSSITINITTSINKRPRSRPLLINVYVNIQPIQMTNRRYSQQWCGCQWCIKSEVFCGNCWMLQRRLEAATGCRRGPQYDGKCSFYLNCYFFHTSPTNRDLREKAVYFPPRDTSFPLWLSRSLFLTPNCFRTNFERLYTWSV